MIIEAGYDIFSLMSEGRFEAGALRVVGLDADFRVMVCRAVSGSFGGDLASLPLDAVDDVIPRPDESDVFAAKYAVRFVALGFEVPKVEGYLEQLDWDRYRELQEWFDGRGIDLLGVYVFNGEGWASTGPMKTFHTYVGAENYPRVLIVRGPHPFLTCSCAVCAPERERFERARLERASEDAV